MGRNYFTEEQIKELDSNKYVEKVSKSNVVFTIEFKHKLYGLLIDGYGPTEALRELGINPKVLGQKRIDALSARIRKQAKREEGFGRTKSHRRAKKLIFNSPGEEIKYLKEQLAYQKEEIEFLKKLEALEKKYQ